MFRQSPPAPMTTRRATSPTKPAPPEREVGEATKPRPRRMRASAELPPVELGPIVRSKIQPPALRTSTLSRQRLIDKLTEATTHRLTLLIAEAGYGKTTLLAEFAAQPGVRAMWYRLDSTDADIVDWTNYLVASAREIDPTFGKSTVELLGEITTGGPPKEAFVTSLISELANLEARPTLLVLDDFHLVDEKKAALGILSRLLRDAPPWLSIVVSTRRRPDLELSRLASQANVAEIVTDDLRFSHAETQQLFVATFQTPLDDDVLRSLEARTMGWAASLQLFQRSVHGRPPNEIRSLARALSGAVSPIYDFLAEEVLGHIEAEIEDFLVRASVLDSISAREGAALLAEKSPPPTEEQVRRLIDEADRLGLLTRSSNSSDRSHLHPLLRDFLFRQLMQRYSREAIRDMHLRVAVAIADDDPLGAARHYVEAGLHSDAMHALNGSLMTTIGSGSWGIASDLLNRITGVPAEPGVAAITARALIEAGDLTHAASVMQGVDVSTAEADIRAVFRLTQVRLAWLTGDPDSMFRALNETLEDPETPPLYREIAALFLSASPSTSPPGALPTIGRRFRDMAATMTRQRLSFYSAIALHDSAVAYLNAADFQMALEVGSEALQRFSSLTFFAPEQLSTHTVMALCEQELGNDTNSEAHWLAALSSGLEFADVPAELSSLATVLGNADRAAGLITRARMQQRQNQSDAVGNALLLCAIALGELGTNARLARAKLLDVSFDTPLELGYSLEHRALLAQAYLLEGEEGQALDITTPALSEAKERGARRAEVRLGILDALAKRDAASLAIAIAEADRTGELAVLEVVDALLVNADMLLPPPSEIDRSIRRHPQRWLPAIRRRLEAGNTPAARSAAVLLDAYGSLDDVGLLRAYAKTYARRGPGKDLGRALARRTSPVLVVHDLGRVDLSIGERTVHVTAMRRKAAAVLMYLVTRPGFAANREQVVDELWPDADPVSAANNLNQSLYFLRRELDPWYEDDVSVDYVELQGDLVWLDRDLVRADSTAFLAAAQAKPGSSSDAVRLVQSYQAPFAPEFEYDDWAMAWRGRVHASFLALANMSIRSLVRQGELPVARDVATHVLTVDPEAADVEYGLIWIYGRMGLSSAAHRLYAEMERSDRLDGIPSAPLAVLLEGGFPDG